MVQVKQGEDNLMVGNLPAVEGANSEAECLTAISTLEVEGKRLMSEGGTFDDVQSIGHRMGQYQTRLNTILNLSGGSDYKDLQVAFAPLRDSINRALSTNAISALVNDNDIVALDIKVEEGFVDVILRSDTETKSGNFRNRRISDPQDKGAQRGRTSNGEAESS